MAASLLAGVDWDNLPSEIPPVIIKLLCLATQERFNIGAISRIGTFFSSSGGGAKDDDEIDNTFPYFIITDPQWELNEGDPVPDFSGEIQNLLHNSLRFYADTEKWTDALGTSTITLFNLNAAADVPGTYDNRLFEITGYTSWPDLSVYAKEEVKKWYDMLTALKKVIRQRGDDQGGAVGDDYMIYDGIFDVEQGKFFFVDQTGADFYTIDPTNYEAVSNTTPFDNFTTANDALFGTLPDSFDESTDSGTYPPELDTPYHIRVARKGDGNYVTWNKSFVPTYVADWDIIEAAIGLPGKPLSYENHQFLQILTNNFPSGEDTNFVFPASTTAAQQRYLSTNILTRNLNIDKITVDLDLTPVDTPTLITDLLVNENVLVKVFMARAMGSYFLEDWDGEDGFSYYTPP